MGTYKKGILGAFSGKVGTVVGSSWRGVDYIKSLPKASNKLPTDLQLIQRARFGMVTGFLKPIGALLNLGYKSQAVNQTGYNAASAQVMKDAIIGEYPDLAIDYPKVQVSYGNLVGAWSTVLSSPASAITFSWMENSTSGNAKPTDQVILLVYNPEKAIFVYTTAGADRSTLADTIAVPPTFVGDTVHAWIAFVSADKKIIATSVYAGNVLVA